MQARSAIPKPTATTTSSGSSSSTSSYVEEPTSHVTMGEPRVYTSEHRGSRVVSVPISEITKIESSSSSTRVFIEEEEEEEDSDYIYEEEEDSEDSNEDSSSDDQFCEQEHPSPVTIPTTVDKFVQEHPHLYQVTTKTTTPVQRRTVPASMSRKKEPTKILNFMPKFHIKGCKGIPGGLTQESTPNEGLLYPTAEIHCRIFSLTMSYFLRNSATSIFNLNDKCITEPLRSLKTLQDDTLIHFSVTPKKLCCKAQLEAIRNLLVVFQNNPISTGRVIDATNKCYSDGNIKRTCELISNFVTEEYQKEGYEFFYFCFVNVKHPFHRAVISELPLNSTTFELCASENSLRWSKQFDERLKHVSGTNSLMGIIDESHGWKTENRMDIPFRGTGFSKRKLMNVIRETALKGVGTSALTRYDTSDKLRKRMNLSIITGISTHKDIPIPGLNISVGSRKLLSTLRKEERWDEYNKLRYWGSTTGVSKYWLEFVYRKLSHTAWGIPRCVIDKQSPEVMQYVYESLLHIQYQPETDWNTSVIQNKDNPNYVKRLPEMRSYNVEWLLDTEGMYIPILTTHNGYRICPSYSCSLDNLRARIIKEGYMKQLKTEAMLYLISEFLQRGLTVKELRMDRDDVMGLLFRVALYGHEWEDAQFPLEEEEERD